MTTALKREAYIKQCVDSFNHLIDNGHTRMDIIDLCKDAGYKEDTIIMFLGLIKPNRS